MANYYTDNKLEIQVGDIIEFPNNNMQYDQTDLVSIVSIRFDELLGAIIKLSDELEICVTGSEFWKVKLVARRIR